jgi:hypothetical protein
MLVSLFSRLRGHSACVANHMYPQRACACALVLALVPAIIILTAGQGKAQTTCSVRATVPPPQNN